MDIDYNPLICSIIFSSIFITSLCLSLWLDMICIFTSIFLISSTFFLNQNLEWGFGKKWERERIHRETWMKWGGASSIWLRGCLDNQQIACYAQSKFLFWNLWSFRKMKPAFSSRTKDHISLGFFLPTIVYWFDLNEDPGWCSPLFQLFLLLQTP